MNGGCLGGEGLMMVVLVTFVLFLWLSWVELLCCAKGETGL